MRAPLLHPADSAADPSCVIPNDPTVPNGPGLTLNRIAHVALLTAGAGLPAIAMLNGFGNYRFLLPAIAVAAVCGVTLLRHHRSRAARTAVATAALASHFLVLAPLAIGVWDRQDWQRDTPTYWLALENARTGEPLYEEMPAGPHRFGEPHYLYPPMFAAVASLTPAVDYATFNRAWLGLALVGFWGFALCLAWLAAGSVAPSNVLVAGLVVAAVPGSLSALIVGQIDPLLWLVAGLALAVPVLRGMGLMVSAMIKLYAVWPMAFGLFRRDRRLVAGAAFTGAALLGLSILALGPVRFLAETQQWVSGVLPSLSQGQFDGVDEMQDRMLAWITTGNLSLSFLPLRFARQLGWDPGAGDLPGAIRAYLSFVGILAPIAAGVLTRRRTPIVQYAFILVAASVFAPMFRASYAPILLLLPATLAYESRLGLRPVRAELRRVERTSATERLADRFTIGTAGSA